MSERASERERTKRREEASRSLSEGGAKNPFLPPCIALFSCLRKKAKYVIAQAHDAKATSKSNYSEQKYSVLIPPKQNLVSIAPTPFAPPPFTPPPPPQLHALLYLSYAHALHAHGVRDDGNCSKAQRVSEGASDQDCGVPGRDGSLLGISQRFRRNLETVDFFGGISGPKEKQPAGGVGVEHWRVPRCQRLCSQQQGFGKRHHRDHLSKRTAVPAAQPPIPITGRPFVSSSPASTAPFS